MGRLHLFEFEDFKGFPQFLRNYMTDFLQFLSNKSKLFAASVPLLDQIFIDTGQKKLPDLGSGGGGALLWIGKQLHSSHPELSIVMTDLYPNISAFEWTRQQGGSYFSYLKDPVDTCSIPKEDEGMRTMFLCLHHFKPSPAKAILQNVIDTKNSIAIFERQERRFASMLSMIFSPLCVWRTTTFIRPFKIGRIIFTYLIPIVPVFVLWDGVISVLRIYSLAEMEELHSGLQGRVSFEWNIGRLRSGPTINLYLIGKQKIQFN